MEKMFIVGYLHTWDGTNEKIVVLRSRSTNKINVKLVFLKQKKHMYVKLH
jgi:hypothetical protein